MSFVAADEDKAWRAVGLFSRALNAQPGDATLWAERAMAYYFLRQMELARRDCLVATAIVHRPWAKLDQPGLHRGSHDQRGL
jgi:Flp pilus assembly protein TadD